MTAPTLREFRSGTGPQQGIAEAGHTHAASTTRVMKAGSRRCPCSGALTRPSSSLTNPKPVGGQHGVSKLS